MPALTVNDSAQVGLGSSDVRDRQLVSWDSSHNDYCAVSLHDRSRKEFLEKLRFGATPSPGTGINLARYVGHGYVLLQPDIVYTTGYPGEDAFKGVVPAAIT